MTSNTANKIIGNQSAETVRNMVAALSLHPWGNTSEDWTRLEAGVQWLRSRRLRIPKSATLALKGRN